MNVCMKYKWKVKINFKKLIVKIVCVFSFDDITNGTKINFNNILINKESYENILVYNISYKSQAGPKPLSIRFDKIVGYIMSLDGKIKHLVLIWLCVVWSNLW